LSGKETSFSNETHQKEEEHFYGLPVLLSRCLPGLANYAGKVSCSTCFWSKPRKAGKLLKPEVFTYP